MSPKIKYLDLNLNRRILFASDIHGNYKLFDTLLKKVNFNNLDYLFIIGDMIEKSDYNLDTLDYFMALDKKENVFILCGNCDNVLSYMIKDVDDLRLKHYAFDLKHTILLEFAKKMNILLDQSSNMEELCHLFYDKFRKYYDFVLNLPHCIIVNNKLCVVHGGISSLDEISNNALDLMKNDNFYEQGFTPKLIEIVGHYPVINYEHQIPSLNPIIDLNKKIISIDGGMSVLPWSQLNMLILDNLKNFNFSYEYIDQYQTVVVKHKESNLNHNSFNVTKKIEVSILEEDNDFFIVKYENYRLYVLKNNLIKKDNRCFVYNAFNYFHNLDESEHVSLVYKGSNLSIVKKNGILGLCHTKSLEVYDGR